MYKDNRYINAGENEIYRYGHKAVEKVESFLEANKSGYYSFPSIGQSEQATASSESSQKLVVLAFQSIMEVSCMPRLEQIRAKSSLRL